ncbi:type II toxin-antitoxin system VapC family toxin [Jatrophihabitans sp. YIM 134969]
MPTPELVCWDSDAFLSYLNKQTDDDRLIRCQATLDRAHAGQVRIVCSALALAEVIKMKHRKPVTRDDEQTVIDFFANEFIVVRNVDRFIAEQARAIVWRNGVDPKDAIHVATAIAVKAAALETFDLGLLKKTDQIGSPVLTIRKPATPLSVGLFFEDDPTDATELDRAQEERHDR